MASRSYTDKQLKALIAVTGNKCEFEGCDFTLVQNGNFLGEIAHIAGLNEGSMRYVYAMTDEERNANENLIVLCRNHHGEIDNDEERYTTVLLTKMKAEHEASVLQKGEPYSPSDSVIKAAAQTIVASQQNTNYGSGMQINTQNFYNTPQELQDNLRLKRRNTRLASEHIRRELRRADADFIDVKAYLERIVIEGVYGALEEDDLDLYKHSLDELRKISMFCFDEDIFELKRSPKEAYLKVIEYITDSVYEIGAYSVDNDKYPPVKYLALQLFARHSKFHDNWLYMMTSTIYRKRNYQNSDLWIHVRDYVESSVAARMGWTDNEVSKNLTQFEYLGNLYQFVYRGHQDFPCHSGFWENSDTEKLLNALVLDDESFRSAFPEVSKKDVAVALIGFNDWLEQHVNISGFFTSGFSSGSNIATFVQDNKDR